MPAPCAVAIAMICMPWQEARIDVDRLHWPATFAVIHVPDGRIELMYDSDDIDSGPWDDAAARRCGPSFCVDYRRKDDGLSVAFTLRGADCDVGRSLRVIGKTAAARDRLVAALSVIPPHGERRDAIPLADLSERTRPFTREERMRDTPKPDYACSD